MKLAMCVLACGSLAGLASADFVGIDAFSGSETVITFTGINTPALGNPADLGHGVTVDNNGGGSGRAGWRSSSSWSAYFSNIDGASGGAALADSWGASDILYSMESGVSRFGLLLSTGARTLWEIEVYDTRGGLIESGRAYMPKASKAVFVGYESTDQLIGGFRITDTENGYITLMDDVRFETVPAPGVLAALGLGGLAASRRRR